MKPSHVFSWCLGTTSHLVVNTVAAGCWKLKYLNFGRHSCPPLLPAVFSPHLAWSLPLNDIRFAIRPIPQHTAGEKRDAFTWRKDNEAAATAKPCNYNIYNVLPLRPFAPFHSPLSPVSAIFSSSPGKKKKQKKTATSPPLPALPLSEWMLLTLQTCQSSISRGGGLTPTVGGSDWAE